MTTTTDKTIAKRDIPPDVAQRQKLGGILENPRTLQAMRAVLPRHLTPERMIKVAISATMRTPKLLECTPESFVLAIMNCAELGLEPGGSLGHAYLVPFKKSWKDAQGRWQSRMEVQMIPGYRGLIALARRSAELSTISAHTVHEHDRYSVQFGDDERIIHEPKLDGERGPIVGAYAIARLRDGGIAREYLTREDLEKIRASSKSADEGPWSDWTDEMSRKSAVRRLAKFLPLSPELAKALELDAESAAQNGDAGSSIQSALELAHTANEASNALEGEALPTSDAPAALEATRSATITDKIRTARRNAQAAVDAAPPAERQVENPSEAEAFERARAQREPGEEG